MRKAHSILSLALVGSAAVAQTSPPASPISPTATAQPIPTEARERLDGRARDVAAVLTGARPADEVFSPAFLAQVPAEQLAALTTQLVSAYGALQSNVSMTATSRLAGEMTMRFAKAEAAAQLVLSPDAPHLITGLAITKVTPVGDSAEAVAKDLAALPGTVAAYFGRLGSETPRLSVNADRQLALGSTSKLYVLAALQRSIAAGEHRWSDVVPLTVRSYPSGLTQDWAPGTPVTIQVLATLMIQISDNTATDQLVALLGREAVEAEYRRTASTTAPTLPFLTTRELFAIKTDPTLRSHYATMGENERRELLATLPKDGPPLKQVGEAFAGAPMAIDRIEWFASPAELARLLQGFTGPEGATARAILSASKGMGADAAAGWSYVGFKGGSEPGVLNFTWLLQDRTGKWHIATLGWNNPVAPVDQSALTALATRMVALAE